MLIERDMTAFSCPRPGAAMAEQNPLHQDHSRITAQPQLQLCQTAREVAPPAHPMVIRKAGR